jgi:hypothetical protein
MSEEAKRPTLEEIQNRKLIRYHLSDLIGQLEKLREAKGNARVTGNLWIAEQAGNKEVQTQIPLHRFESPESKPEPSP